MFEQIIAIAGVPRSGTSWLGQIIDSNPQVRYRYQPIFSYAFKDAVDEDSSKEEYIQFFYDIYKSRDDFLCQKDKKEKGLYPHFDKVEKPSVLAFKNVRYHYLLEDMLQYFDNLKVVGIVRHPCGVINSWLTTPKEFPADADPMEEWRYGECRNTGPEEYWGFEKWKEVANFFLRLKEGYTGKFYLLKYAKLVENPVQNTQELFHFLGLGYTDQTHEFLLSCHERHDKDNYSVYKDKSVREKWRWQLDERIQEEIISEIKGTKLETFLI